MTLAKHTTEVQQAWWHWLAWGHSPAIVWTKPRPQWASYSENSSRWLHYTRHNTIINLVKDHSSSSHVIASRVRVYEYWTHIHVITNPNLTARQCSFFTFLKCLYPCTGLEKGGESVIIWKEAKHKTWENRRIALTLRGTSKHAYLISGWISIDIELDLEEITQ